MTAPRITSTKSFKYATATVLFFGLAFIGHAMVSFLDIVKMTPVSVVVTPQASLPNEVKTLEATTVGQAFDRDTTTSYTAYGTDQISVQFESVELLHRFKVFGPAPYKVSIAVDNGNGTTTPISGWQNLSLAFLAANAWTEFDLSTDVNAQALVVTLTPQTGGSATGIQEMEFWGTGSVWNMNGASWVSAFQGSSAQGLQLGGREYDAKPDQITVGTVSGQTSTTNSFTLNVNHVGNDFKRAWLVYEINGLPSWIAPLRAVNGEADMGGWPLPGNNGWTTQVEEIDPRLLENGSNTVRFDLPSAIATGYQVRNLKVIGELDTGANLISSIEVPTGNGDLMLDGDETTGWSPWLKATSGSSPYMILHLARLSQIDDVKVYMKGSLSGQIKVSAEDVNGNWSNLGSGVQGGSLGQGWQDLRVKTSGMVQAVQLQFLNGSGSSGQIMELVAFGSGSGLPYGETINVTYPDQGQFYGRLAYIRGFLGTLDNGSGAAQLFIGGSPVTLNGNAFEATVSKDAVGFASSADGDPWNVVITELFPDGTKVEQKVFFNQELGAVSSNGNQAGSSTYGLNLKPGQGKAINVAGAQLIIDGTAVTSAVNLQVIPLSELDLPGMDSGMINVTGDPYRGYRFLPHGTHFAHAVTLALPYDPDLIPGGSNEQDIQTYYFDKEQGRWVPLTKASVDTTNHLVYSLTDHFTDFVNATVTVPDHPQETSFNPTQLKDIKAADPGAEINLIEPPSANNQGTANLSYPIEVPPGRHGIQPQLAVAYNSGGGNGWMGVGWDLPIQQITVETRWGAPRYDSGNETETYLLNGEMLVEEAPNGNPYLAHRMNGPGFITRNTSGSVTFHTRVEGKFERIIRHGTTPKTYYWEVQEKTGTISFFGGANKLETGYTDSTHDPAALTDNTSDNTGNVFVWALKETKDLNDNTVFYHYHIHGAGFAQNGSGNEIYLDHINYTGTGGLTDTDTGYSYQIFFYRTAATDTNPTQTGFSRLDAQVNAKGGFPWVTADVLQHIDISLVSGPQAGPVRSYQFNYQTGPFFKTLLSSVQQFGANKNLFQGNTHQFKYYDDIRSGGPTGNPNANLYKGFKTVTWDLSNVNERTDLGGNLAGIFDNKASAINGSRISSGGFHFYGGYIPPFIGLFKNSSIGVKFGSSSNETDGLVSMIDMNGDGLPDKVYVQNGQVFYRPNLSGPSAGTSFGTPIPVDHFPEKILSQDKSDMFSGGLEAYLGLGCDLGANGFFNGSGTLDKGYMYFTDVNGDGVPDFVDNGTVYFGHVDPSSGAVSFTQNTTGTGNPLSGPLGLNSTGLLPDFSNAFTQAAADDPLVDVVRRWTAPYDGTVSIYAPVTLNPIPTSVTNPTADGVRAAIELDNASGPSILNSAVINIPATGTPTPALLPVGVLNVAKGDRIYFRLQSIYDGSFDQVQWDPQIQYTVIQGTPAVPVTDANNLDETHFQPSKDFSLAGQTHLVGVPFDGTMVLQGDFVKKGTTTDSVTILVVKNPVIPGVATPAPDGGPTTLVNQLIGAGEGPVTVSMFSGTGPRDSTPNNPLTFQVSNNTNTVASGGTTIADTVWLMVEADSNIDLRQLQWVPLMHYIPNVPPDTRPNDTRIHKFFDPSTGAPVNFVNAPYDIQFYPRNDLSAPQSFFTVPAPTFTPSPVPTLTSVQQTAGERAVFLIKGNLDKTVVTTSDVLAQVLVNGTVAFQQDIPAASTGTFPVTGIVGVSGTPTPPPVVIQEFLPIPAGGAPSPGAEYVILRNTTASSIDISNYHIGNDPHPTASPTPTGNLATYTFPSGSTIPAGAAVIVAVNGANFQTAYSCAADYQLNSSSSPAAVLTKVNSSGNLSLSTTADTIILWNSSYGVVDSVAYGSQSLSTLSLINLVSGFDITPPSAGDALTRVSAMLDTDRMSVDFNEESGAAPCNTKAAALTPILHATDQVLVRLVTDTQAELNNITWIPQTYWAIRNPGPPLTTVAQDPTYQPAYEAQLTADGITRVRNFNFTANFPGAGTGPLLFAFNGGFGFEIPFGDIFLFPAPSGPTSVASMVFTVKELNHLLYKQKLPVYQTVSSSFSNINFDPFTSNLTSFQWNGADSFTVPSMAATLEVTLGAKLFLDFTGNLTGIAPTMSIPSGQLPFFPAPLVVQQQDDVYNMFHNTPLNGYYGLLDGNPQITAFNSMPKADWSSMIPALGGFPLPYRNWSECGVKENKPGLITDVASASSPTGPLSEGDFAVPTLTAGSSQSDIQNAFSAMKVVTLQPNPGANLWDTGKPNDDDIYVGAGTQSSSRLGADALGIPTLSDILKGSAGAGAGGYGPIRLSNSDGTAFGGGIQAGGINITGTSSSGHANSTLDFMDMNGDGYPSVVRQGSIQYTLPTGCLNETIFEPQLNGALSNIRVTENHSVNGGGGASFPSTDSDAQSAADSGQSCQQGAAAQFQADSKAHIDTKGTSQSNGNNSGHSQMVDIGFSGNVGNGTSDADTEFIDINGDGLPDKVSLVPESGNSAVTDLVVQINTGYGFTTSAVWSTGVNSTINHGQTNSASLGISGGNTQSLGDSLGSNEGSYGFGGGLDAELSISTCPFTLADITGDGLPDLIKMDVNNPTQWIVYFNTGSGFQGPVTWTGVADTIAKSHDLGFGAGVYFTISIPIPFVGTIVLNPGGDFTIDGNSARQEIMLTDINGDGYPDQLETTNEGSLTVHQNNRGRTNLLKEVDRPLGAVISLDYQRDGNTYANPHSRWNLSSVAVFDGGQNKNNLRGGADYQATKYDYFIGTDSSSVAIPAWDRFEREFLGYAAVTETQLNTTGWVPPSSAVLDLNSAVVALSNSTNNPYRRVMRQYLNLNFYEKGLVTQENTDDVQNGISNPVSFLETDTTYNLVDVDKGTIYDPTNTSLDINSLNAAAVVFPQAVTVTKHYFEGNQGNLTTFQTFLYDKTGSVTLFYDHGDAHVTDSAVTAFITYIGGIGSNNTGCSSYLAGLADSVHVLDANGHELRHREATFDCAGNMGEERAYLASGQSSLGTVVATDMKYDGNGSVTQVIGPPNSNQVNGTSNQPYTLTYGYDPDSHTYPQTITDSFGYQTFCHYNLKFGKMDNDVDENNQPVTTVYDEWGRTVTVVGPFEANGPVTHSFTISFDYSPFFADASGNTLDSNGNPIVPYAFTRHFDVQHPNQTIDTILFTDGLKRVIQTKKNDTVNTGGTNTQNVMTVSGRAVFDHVGRTIAQYYPVTEAKNATMPVTLSANVTFNGNYDSVTPTTMTYDILDRNLHTIIPDSTGTTITYGIAGNSFATTVVDAKQNHKETFRDLRELITSVVEHNSKGTADQNNITTTYSYDPLKEIVSVVDPKNNTTTVTYDNLGRRLSINNPDTGLVTMTYDLASNVIAKQTANLQAESKAVSYFYNFNRLEQIKYPDFPNNNVTYTYGAPGQAGPAFGNVAARIMQVADEAGTVTRAYDALGNIAKEKRLLKVPVGNSMPSSYTTQYTYDTWNRMQNMVYADGETLTYHYDSGGNADAVTGVVGGVTFPYVTSVQYDKFEQRVFVQNGNGTTSTYSYIPTNRRLQELVHNSSVDGTIADLNYTYDNVGNITDLLNNGVVASQNIGGPVTQHFDYDDLYRLTAASGDFKGFDPSAGESFESKYTLGMTYDAIHNIVNKDQKVFGKHASGKDFAGDNKPTYDNDYTYGTDTANIFRPHAPLHIGGRTFTYDLDGNQTGYTQSGGPNRAIVWDEENRIQAIKDGGGDPLTSGINFIYDDSGSRIMKAKGGDVTAYINQFFTVRQPHSSAGAAMSKHVFIGNTRILSQVEHGSASFADSTSGLSGSSSTSGSGSGTTSGTGFVTVTTSTDVYQGATQSSPPEGMANVGDILELMGTKNHGGTMDKVMFQGLIGFIPTGDVTASTTTSKSGGKGGNKGGGGSTAGTSTSVLPQVPDDHFVFYYHTDHLGSTGLVTDRSGKLSENVQYFPFGETWVDQHRGMSPFPDYLFTGKELDTETGLYYYGARYYDPRTSVWQSADPFFDKYLLSYKTSMQALFANGIYSSDNLSLYSYGKQNPVQFVDENGMWASKVTNIHQRAIESVLGNQVPQKDILVMQSMQREVDKYQTASNSYMHSMTPQGTDKAAAIAHSNQFIKSNIVAAQKALGAGEEKQAYMFLGIAIHTIQDASSPAHRGFQEWSDMKHWYQAPAYFVGEAYHVSRELFYPLGGSEERAELEGSTQWVYDIFSGKQAMPDAFFNSKTGRLNLPQFFEASPETDKQGPTAVPSSSLMDQSK